MILNNVKIAATDELVNIRLDNEKITNISSSVIADADGTPALTFDDAIVFPGLINSHDHLDFNLFPQLGDRTYSNYTEWGKHIHLNYKDEIDEILKIPSLLRSNWGLYKNLLCGVTTVVNHGERLGTKHELITVFEDTHCIHSTQFDKAWKFRLNNPFKLKLPVTIHIGEGDDWPSYSEIDQLTRWNLLQKELIGIHGVAMSEEQAKKFKAVVWCPQSNYFLLDKTARVNLLKNHTGLLFGTDSALTSSWDIWNHLCLARKTKLVSDKFLYSTITCNAAKIWGLNCGEIAIGRDADIVVATTKAGTTGFDSFFGLCPADLLLVTHKGNIRLFDDALLIQLKKVDLNDFSRIYINGACKYVQGNLPGLIEKIRGYQPNASFPVSVAKTA
ncbi:MAG TPA: amidohydrolase family protein [Mucilaginibacter sp.]|jgi:cytosine/adenosine deaminase-related metal-dependent hydrolase